MGNMLDIDFSCFSDYAEKLEKLGADLQQVFDKVMLDAAEEVQQETKAALSSANLPAKGRYSRGKTMDSVIEPKVEWNGSIAEVKLGFDKSKPGAGGFLITGTPKMAPDNKLNEIYAGKKFERQINKKIKEALQEEIDKRMK